MITLINVACQVEMPLQKLSPNYLAKGVSEGNANEEENLEGAIRKHIEIKKWADTFCY